MAEGGRSRPVDGNYNLILAARSSLGYWTWVHSFASAAVPITRLVSKAAISWSSSSSLYSSMLLTSMRRSIRTPASLALEEIAAGCGHHREHGVPSRPASLWQDGRVTTGRASEAAVPRAEASLPLTTRRADRDW